MPSMLPASHPPSRPPFLLHAALPLSIVATLYVFLLPYFSHSHDIHLFGHYLFTIPIFAQPGIDSNNYWTISHYISYECGNYSPAD